MDHAHRYLENRVMTASKEDLFLMLFDGALRFCEQARVKLQDEDRELAGTPLVRAQKIVLELVACWSKDDLPADVHAAVLNLYDFVYHRLVKANLERRAGPLDEAQRILAHLRDTWAAALDKDRQDRFPMLARLAAALPVDSGPVSLEG